MSNPLFETLGGNQTHPGFNEILRQFQQFKQTFSGDPKAQVQQLLNSGKMTQADFNRLSAMANQLSGLLK